MRGKGHNSCPASSSGYLFPEHDDEDGSRPAWERFFTSNKAGWRLARIAALFWPLIAVALAFSVSW
jgi:hypothetical protein